MRRILPLIFSLALLVGVVYASDPAQVLNTVRSSNVAVIALGVAAWFLGATLRIWRWNFLLKHVGIRLPLRDVVSIFLAGFYLSNITPGKTGDPIRAVMLKRQHNESFSNALPSVVVERLADLSVMVILASIGALFLPPVIDKSYVYMVVAVFIVVVLGLLFVLPSQKRTERFLKTFHRVFSFIPKVRALEGRIDASSYKISSSFASYKNGGVFLSVGASTLFIWLLEGAVVVLSFKAIGLSMPFWWAIVILPIATLVGVLSFLPGGIGSSELASVAFFVSIASVTPAQATAAALIGRLMSYWLYVLAGSLVLARMKKL